MAFFRDLDVSCILIPLLIVFHLWVAPYTKVEESFNIQATHDVLVYGLPISNVYERLSSTYDHFTFPGAVPRTFVGSVLLAGVSRPLIALFGFGNAQHIVRLVLGLFNAFAMMVMMHNIQRALGRGAGRWYALLQASQFHVMFYASRTLPNMFAFGLTTIAYGLLSSRSLTYFSTRMNDPFGMFGRQRLAVSLLVFAAVIFRSEVALFLLTITVTLIAIPFTYLEVLIPPFVISFTMALLVTVSVDSYFWQEIIWPELWGFYYNAVLGSSSAWGVSPWHFYFTSALPRLLLNPLVYLVLIPAAWRRNPLSWTPTLLTVPSLLFVAIYSLQPHKEARFIFYVVPPLTAAATVGADWIFTRRNKTLLYRLASYLLVLSVLASFAASITMSLVSSLNYPGGHALAFIRSRVEDSARAKHVPGYEATPHGVVRVHADVLSCMTGVTLFGTSSTGLPAAATNDSLAGSNTGTPGIILDKTEDPVRLSDPDFWLQFDYLLAEDPKTVMGGEWEEEAVVEGYAGVEILRPGMEVPSTEEESDVEKAGEHKNAVPGKGGERKRVVIGKGKDIAALRDKVRVVSGGWWVGPRMEPKIRILRRVKDGKGGGMGTQA